MAIVNPNSPTGKHIPRRELESLLAPVPEATRVWVDETYVEYAGEAESLESFAARSKNIMVCKSMSKVYALSGTRVAYLCAPEATANLLREITPPWAVSLPAQVAAVNALGDPEYYAVRYSETRLLRETLAGGLRSLGIEVVPGAANFLLCHLPGEGPDAATVCRRCRTHDVFLRDASRISDRLGPHALRIAVKDRQSNSRIIETLKWAITADAEDVPALAVSA